MKKPPFVNNGIYHVYNRGVEKRKIFLDNQDYFRAVHDLFEFNDKNPALTLYYKQANLKSYEVEPHKIGGKEKEPRKLLVRVLAFCLMPNHFHLLLQQAANDGIIKFMQKIGTGYTMYFNQKYERVGPLFQGRFKAKLVDRESHFIHLPYYIHCNPLDLKFPGWREKEIKDHKKAMEFLEEYRWSSFPDYIGKKNFPSVTQREFLSEFFSGSEQYKKDTLAWLKEIDLGEIDDVVID